MPSCILYQNASATITVVDIPRSIEEAQGSLPSTPKLISTKPLEHPHASVEPKSARAKAAIGQVSLEDLLLRRHLELAVGEVRTDYKGPWCLPRTTLEEGEYGGQRKRKYLEGDPLAEDPKAGTAVEENHVLPEQSSLFHKSGPESIEVLLPAGTKAVVPAGSTFIQGNVSETLNVFSATAPKFDIVVLDPPWPNRSARRKKEYSISYDRSEIRNLLSSIPLHAHLVDAAYVAVWITNKPAFREMVVGEGGLFTEWNVQLVEEWVWLKVTSNGSPVCALDSTWRKPYEVLLVGRRGGGEKLKRRVIMGVPDLHSRKPNLKAVFERTLRNGTYTEGLEIFARNLTAGWWSWGNEVLRFQTSNHWQA